MKGKTELVGMISFSMQSICFCVFNRSSGSVSSVAFKSSEQGTTIGVGGGTTEQQLEMVRKGGSKFFLEAFV